jgi:hypothetical protein
MYKLHKRSQKVFVWAVDDPKIMSMLIENMADGIIIINYPDWHIEILLIKQCMMLSEASMLVYLESFNVFFGLFLLL